MSLADSFADELEIFREEGAADAVGGEGSILHESFADCDELYADDPRPSDAQSVSELAASGSDAPPAEVAPARKRGRKHGDIGSAVLRRVIAEDKAEAEAAAPEVSLSDKRRAAARKRWTRRESDAPSSEPASVSYQLVELSADDVKSSAVLELGEKSLQAFHASLAQEPDRGATGYERQLDLFNHMAHMVTKTSAAETANTSRRSVTRKTRLLAAIIILVRRFNNLMSLKTVHSYLCSVAGDEAFEALAFIQKEKFDEVSFFLRVTESTDKGRLGGDKDADQKETVIAKLLQVSITYHCVWKVGSEHVHLKLKQPTVMQSIENNTAEAIKAALQRMYGDLSFARSTFKLTGRMPITDEAGAITKCNYAILEAMPWLKLAAFVCKLHKKHKAAKTQLEVFRMDRSGLVNLCLSLQYGGAFRKFKRALKFLIKRRLVVRPWGTDGPGANATKHNEQVLALYLHADADKKMSGKGVSKRLSRVVARRVLLNGNLDSPEVQHWERNCCPRGPKQTLGRINKHVVNTMTRPRPWNTDKWLGAESSQEFTGEWLNTNNLLVDAYRLAFAGGDATDKDEHGSEASSGPSSLVTPRGSDAASSFGDVANLADLEGLDDETLQSAASAEATGSTTIPVYKEVGTGDSGFQRSHVYRINTLRWFKTKPQGRFCCMKRLCDVQQHDCAALMAQVGEKWDKKEMKSRSKGNPPNYRIVDAANGKYTMPALSEYGSLIREGSHWEVLPAQHHTHALSNQVYRSAAVSSATMYQLERIRERTYPYLPGQLLSSSPAQMFLLAERMIEHHEKFRCLLPSFWEEFIRLYPNVADLLGRH